MHHLYKINVRKATWCRRASLVAQRLKCLLAMRETWVRSLSWEDLLEKEMATHCSILAWEVPRTEEPGGLQSTGWQRVRHDWVISLSLSIVVQELADNLFIVTVLVISLFKYRGWSGVLIWKVIEWNAGGSVFTTYVIGWTKKHKHGIV